MSLKIHFLNSHLSNFLENFGAVSEKECERFNQGIKGSEKNPHRCKYNSGLLPRLKNHLTRKAVISHLKQKEVDSDRNNNALYAYFISLTFSIFPKN